MKVNPIAVEIDFENGFGLEVHDSQVMLKIKNDDCPAVNTMWMGGDEMVHRAWIGGHVLELPNGMSVAVWGDKVEITTPEEYGEIVETLTTDEFLERIGA